jgi:hypothetical protein
MSQILHYEKGMARRYAPKVSEECDDSFGYGGFECPACGKVHRPDYEDEIAKDAAFLPHSCSEWIIGGEDEIKMLIADLQALL